MANVPSSPSSPLAVGVLIGGRYRLGTALGAGAMGVVYSATDERLGREVAIKVIRGNHLKDGAALARFEREAVLTGKLGHPNIVGVTDLGRTDDGHPFVVMERLEGRTLDAHIREARQRNAPVPVDEAVSIHVQLLDALNCAHDAGVLHRDIKPANVFLSSLATGAVLVKLLDFGIAAPLSGGQKLTVDGSVIGSPVYLAPERFRGKPAQVESDLYAVGISLYETLVGSVPFDSLPGTPIHERVFNERPRSIDALRSDVSPALAQLVGRALEKLPEARFPSARAMREALLAVTPRAGAADPRAGAADGAVGGPLGKGGTVLGVSDPSAPMPSRMPASSPVGDAPRTVPLRRVPAVAAPSESLPTRATKSKMPLLVGISVLVVVASVALGALAGLRAGQSEPPATAASVGAPSAAVPSTVVPSTAAPSTVVPSTAVPSAVAPSAVAPSTVAPSTVVPSTEAASLETALPVGVDPPPPIAGELAPLSPATPAPHAAHGGAHRPTAPRPSVVVAEPAPEPVVAPVEPEPRPRARMGADGLIHPNW